MESTTEEDKDTMDDFLKSNYQLFNILSVFGAIALYLTTVGENDASLTGNSALILNLGIVGSLLLFAFVAVIIDRKYFQFILEYISGDSVQSHILIFYTTFIIMFNIVMLVILFYLSTFSQSVLVLGATIGAIILAAIVFDILTIVLSILNKISSWNWNYFVVFILAAIVLMFTPWDPGRFFITNLSESIPGILS